jgi:DNA-binding response OmpR family regulator
MITTHRDATVILPPNSAWFEGPEIANEDPGDPSTAIFAFRRTRRTRVQVPVGGEVIVGRRHEAHSVQPDLDLSQYNAAGYGVSRLHAKLRREEYGWWFEDLASANGTWVNGEQLQPYTPVSLGVQNKIVLSTMPLHIFLPGTEVAGMFSGRAEPRTPLHIVNIEDDRDLQRLMGLAFRESEKNLNLQQFISGDFAIPYVMQHFNTIDLFVIDIMLPGKYNGIQIAQFIRSIGCPGHIILTSAFADPSADLLSSINAQFFPKPLHIMDIVPRLASYRLPTEQPHEQELFQQQLAEAIPIDDGRTSQPTLSASVEPEPYHESEAAYSVAEEAIAAVGKKPVNPPPTHISFEPLEVFSENTPVLEATPAEEHPDIVPALINRPKDQRSGKFNLVQRLIKKLRGI